MAKMPCAERARTLKNICGFEVRSGKWFFKEEESSLKQVRRAIINNGLANNPSELNELIDMYEIMYEEPLDWYVPASVKYFYSMLWTKADIPFPLNREQLTIINRLLFHPDDEKFFILTGVGGSGKSTFLNIIKQLFDNDVSASTLADLSNEFKLEEALRHRLICADELNSDDINNGAVKTICSRQPVHVNRKYGSTYQTRSQSAMIFSCNKPPRLNISDSGMMRRVVFYSMNKKIENPNSAMKSLVLSPNDKANIIALAAEVDNDNWEDLFKDDTRRVLKSTNSVYLTREYFDYERYVDKCLRARYKPFSENNWREIAELFSLWEGEEQSELWAKEVYNSAGGCKNSDKGRNEFVANEIQGQDTLPF